MSGPFTEWMRVVDSLSDTYTDDGIHQWMTSPNRHLGDITPQQAIAEGRGVEVLALADRLAGGPKRSPDQSSLVSRVQAGGDA